ncbi:hypothetical protein F4779DRAFT_294161 [Xylariaceae sp. FL0662B]|nr:hypothetical protein F4779DRAFT_294161 [Xylariaceae sp. FL0662B]
MATETPIYYGPPRLEGLSAEDFETASIRSAAPSYVSEAPSYHSTTPTNEPVPAYTPPESENSSSSSSSSTPRYASMLPPLTSTSTPTPMTSTFTPGAGLPRVPSPRRRNHSSDVPQMNQFRIPTWSSLSRNPNVRHYESVANRRVSAAASAYRGGVPSSSVEGALRTALGRINAASTASLPDENDSDRVRPLEDPHLVGEEAAARARSARLARENGDDILYQEEKRWDWFLTQMKERDERDRGWTPLRGQFENMNHSRFGRRFGR